MSLFLRVCIYDSNWIVRNLTLFKRDFLNSSSPRRVKNSIRELSGECENFTLLKGDFSLCRGLFHFGMFKEWDIFPLEWDLTLQILESVQIVFNGDYIKRAIGTDEQDKWQRNAFSVCYDDKIRSNFAFITPKALYWICICIKHNLKCSENMHIACFIKRTIKFSSKKFIIMIFFIVQVKRLKYSF